MGIYVVQTNLSVQPCKLGIWVDDDPREHMARGVGGGICKSIKLPNPHTPLDHHHVVQIGSLLAQKVWFAPH
jgi:hypothetical protein